LNSYKGGISDVEMYTRDSAMAVGEKIVPNGLELEGMPKFSARECISVEKQEPMKNKFTHAN